MKWPDDELRRVASMVEPDVPIGLEELRFNPAR
jgi:hypothetical protein